MKAKLFLFYLRFRKPIILLSTLVAAVIVGLDYWQKYKYRTADYTPWTLVTVNSGSSFTVSRHNETKTIDLCGVSASGDKAKSFLQSVIKLGDGTVELERVGDRYEAWILLDENYDTELVKHISTEPNYLVEQQIHLNTWVIERGYASQDLQSAGSCSQPEHLAWADKVAREEKLGMWKDQ
jgi:endonuclease YncB( thermonuclease family)